MLVVSFRRHIFLACGLFVMLLIVEGRGAAPPQDVAAERGSEAVPLEGGSRPAAPGPHASAPHAKPSPYWLGIECRPLPEALRGHLNLPEGEGLLIAQIVPDSPSAAAKLQPDDVLLKIDGTAVRLPSDVVHAVDAVHGKKVTAEIIRGGKPMRIEITPAPRPPELLFQPGTAWDSQPQWQEMFKLLEKARQGDPGRPPFRFRFVQPGALLPPGAAMPPIPGDLRVTITKQGDQPAKLHVERGREKWELTEAELEKLPADVQGHVERLLGHSSRAPAWAFGELPSPPRGEKRAEPAASTVEERLEEMALEIEELRKAIDNLRAKR